MRWIRRFMYWLRFRARGDDLRNELLLHQELLAGDLQRRGMTPDDATAAARRAMGNATYMREEARGVWLWPRGEALLQDWRYAWRGLRRSPAFALVAIVSLGLGIGANTAIFGLIHALLLARLPIPAATELVEAQRDLGAKGTDERFSRAEFEALANGPLPLAMFSSSFASVEIDGVPSTASLDAVSAGYFALLRVGAARGRVIAPSDDDAAAPVAVVTDRFWRGRLNADSAVLGRTIKIDDQPVTVIGVTPPGFAGLRFPATTDIMMPYRGAMALGVIRDPTARQPLAIIIARRAARPIGNARDRLAVLWSHCCRAGDLEAPQRGQVASSSELLLVDVSRGIPQVKLNLRGQYTRILLALMVGVGILLLAACANVANLLLARSSARTGELAVRLALGASRPRLVVQLVIESLQLSLLGALLGLLLARWGTALLSRTRIGDLSGVLGSAPPLGPAVLAFTIVVSVASGLLFGVVPALRVMRADLITPLKQGGRRAAVSGRRCMVDRALVALQMALALLLVSGASLLIETLRNLQRADLGMDVGQQLVFHVETRHTPYAQRGMTVQMAEDILRRVRAIPGVRVAAFGSMVPITGGRSVADNVTVRGGAPLADGDPQTAFTAVTPGYFAALGMPLLSGRDMERSVAPAAAFRDVVVNRQFAEKFFPGRNPIGQQFEDADEGDTASTENRVIGVVAGARYLSLRAPATPMYFVPVADHDWPFLELVVRPHGGAAVGLAVARTIAAVAPGIGQGEPVRLSAAIDDALVRERISATLALLFGIVALSLVAVGLYGVMLYQVAERTTEIGIRMALGAGARSVVALVLRQSLAIVAIGVAAGVPLAMLAGRVMSSQLYGVAPYSAAALAVAASSLVAVAIAASLIPVRHAVGVDPLTALRAE